MFDYHVFVSQNTDHKPYARSLVSRLRDHHLSVFFDEDCILPGEDIVRAVERGLARSRHVALVLSQGAVGSRWVSLEWATSMYRDPDAADRAIIPIIREDCDIPLSLARLKSIDGRDEDVDRHVAEVLAGLDLASVPLTDTSDSHDLVEVPGTSTETPLARIPGGAMPSDSPLYVERRSDRELQARLAEGAGLLGIWGPRQMGKTSMIFRALHRSKLGGKPVAYVNCSALVARSLSEFVSCIARAVWRVAGGSGRRTDHSPTLDDHNRAIEDLRVAFRAAKTPSILVLDELDYVRCLPQARGFMQLLRSLVEIGSLEPETSSRLQLVLGSFLSPPKLVFDPVDSPFNVGVHLRLLPFDRKEADELVRSVGLTIDEVELHEVLRFTGGHPYLVHQLAYIAARERLAVTDIIGDETHYREYFALHIRTLENHIESDELARRALIAFQEGSHRFSDSPHGIKRLVDLGVVSAGEDGIARYTSNLYRSVFGNK